jgi:ABC-type enterobactin transport system permease subunit
MNGGRKTGTQGGGAIIAGAILAGVIGGIIVGQPSIGFLAGAAAGVLIALLFWLKERRG